MRQKPQQELFPLHLLLSKLDSKAIDQLPEGHALTGCDTVAKVRTKEELLHILNSFDPLITGFGRCSTFDKLRAKPYHHQSNNK